MVREMVTIRARVDSRIRLVDEDIPAHLREEICAMFEHTNPDFGKAAALGYSTWNIPRTIVTWRERENEVNFPRGGMARIQRAVQAYGYELDVEDARVDGEALSRFTRQQRKLWPHQEEIVGAILKTETCIIKSGTGSGKTSAMLASIPRLRRTALVVVHSSALADQWVERCGVDLGLKINEIGRIQGDMFRLLPVTIGMQQTLNNIIEAGGQKKKEMLEYFGAVFQDECFEGSTPVLMEDGTTKCIDEVVVGDRVASGGKVQATSRRENVQCSVTLNNYLVTDDHPIAVRDCGWVRARELVQRDRFFVHKSEGGETKRSMPDGGDWRRALEIDPLINSLDTKDFLHGRAEVGRVERTSVAVYNLETANGVYVAAGVLVHNCHFAAAKTFLNVLDPFPAKYRVGASADHRRKDKKDFLINDLFGEVEAQFEHEDMVDQGRVMDVEFRLLNSDFQAEWYVRHDASEKRTFIHLVQEMAMDQDRERMWFEHLAREVVDGQQVLVMVHEVAHCNAIAHRLVTRDIPFGMLVGGSENRAEFKRTIEGLKNKKIRVGVGTYKAIGTGIDVPSVGVGFAVTPIAANEQFVGQVRGRVCRTAPGKEIARLYIVTDPNVYGERHHKNLAKWNTNTVQLVGETWMPV